MNAPDWAAIEASKDARRYSDLCNEAEIESRTQYERGVQANKACAAIRACDLDGATVRQILSTLGCEMTRQGFCPADVEMIETAGECVG